LAGGKFQTLISKAEMLPGEHIVSGVDFGLKNWPWHITFFRVSMEQNEPASSNACLSCLESLWLPASVAGHPFCSPTGMIIFPPGLSWAKQRLRDFVRGTGNDNRVKRRMFGHP
jgi:hypothetical protein